MSANSQTHSDSAPGWIYDYVSFGTITNLTSQLRNYSYQTNEKPQVPYKLQTPTTRVKNTHIHLKPTITRVFKGNRFPVGGSKK